MDPFAQSSLNRHSAVNVGTATVHLTAVMTMATRLMAANIETANNDAEGGPLDWEEDPLGFDTNPMLLRAMCMAFE